MSAVRLTWSEIRRAAVVGVDQRVRAIADGRVDFARSGSPGFSEHVVGAIGEFALAVYLDRCWRPLIGELDTSRGDVAGLQVRSTWRGDGALVVRPRDPLDDVFVLCALDALPVVRIVGWITGRSARRDAWHDEREGRPPAWLVPQPELEAIERLPDFDRRSAA